METLRRLLVTGVSLVFMATALALDDFEPTAISLGIQPALSPDGKRIAFVWSGDIWLGATKGGRVRQLSQHPGQEWTPKFSPDGKEIAFVSDREGSLQIYVTPVAGGVAKKLTDHSEGYYLLGWDPDGKSLLARGRRDHVGRKASRLLRVSRGEFGKETLLFDAAADRAEISPDGNQVLFTREGVDVYRKGYRGSQASQIWRYDLKTKKFELVVKEDGGARSPLWRPDGKGFYFVAQRGGAFNLIEREFGSEEEEQLTELVGDGVVRPALSRDGETVVFRRGSDFYRAGLGEDAKRRKVQRLRFRCATDIAPSNEVRRLLKSATEVAFTDDGMELAMVAGGDIWVMDTILREPQRVTDSVAEEKEVMFAKDGKSIYFLSDSGLECQLQRTRRKDEKKFWWQNSEFDTEELELGAEVISNIDLSPDGKRISFVTGLGDLWVADPDGGNRRQILQSWNMPRYDWSPDGRWLAYSAADNNFNYDVWIVPSDGSMLPYNLSRHPDFEGSPRWSPDGKILAFSGRRHGEEVDMYYVWLQKQHDEKSGRERSEEEALEAMKKARKKGGGGGGAPQQSPAGAGLLKDPLKGLMRGLQRVGERSKAAKQKRDGATGSKLKPGETTIDFDGLASRVRRISVPDTREGGLFWSPDSKKLAFSAEVKGVEGLYSVEFPDKLSPSLIVGKKVSSARWLEKDERIVWLEDGVPGSFAKGKQESYRFEAAQSFDRPEKFRIAFLQIWRAMRDHFYDGAHNGQDWDAVREKYEAEAAGAADLIAFETLVSMLLGELNGSHLGFRPSSDLRPQVESGEWPRVTAHLGVRFTEDGGRLVVASVIPGGPADREASRLEVGDVIVSAGGVEVKTPLDLLPVLNGRPGQRIEVVVDRGGKKLDPLQVPSISYSAARRLKKVAWVDANRREVERRSDGRFGYLYVERMMWDEFENFEREVYAVGAGKDGIVIDVRDNGGGFTADHLLTVLTPPEHAVTVPRGGGAGYPGDRRVYGTWGKPIVVLCNQNSFSNAEIFSHAVKILGRGKLIGVPTAGGVISTGSKSIMDIGTLRMPFRGWFKADDGEDMELNGAVPDFIIWPEPGELAAGIDRQLHKAVDVLESEVEAYSANPRPGLRRASERR